MLYDFYCCICKRKKVPLCYVVCTTVRMKWTYFTSIYCWSFDTFYNFNNRLNEKINVDLEILTCRSDPFVKIRSFQNT